MLGKVWHLPRPECNEEAPPGEEEYSAILVERVQDGDRSSLEVDRVDGRSLPEGVECDHADYKLLAATRC